MACSNILETVADLLVRKAGGVISKLPILEHVHRRILSLHAISKLLYLQMILLLVDSAYSW